MTALSLEALPLFSRTPVSDSSPGSLDESCLPDLVLDDLAFPNRARKVFKRLRIRTLGQLLLTPSEKLLQGRGFGTAALAAVRRTTRARLLQGNQWEKAMTPRSLETLPLFSGLETPVVGAIELHESYLPGFLLDDLVFPARARTIFKRLHIRTLGRLLLTSYEELLMAKGCGVSTLAEIRRAVKGKLLRSNSQIRHELDLSSFDAMVRCYVRRVIRRERDVRVMLGRLGLNGTTRTAYQDIADRFDLTRSRVGQIVHSSIRLLEMSGNLDLLQPFWAAVGELVRKQGGIIDLEELAAGLAKHFHWGAPPSEELFDFVLSLNPEFSLDDEAGFAFIAVMPCPKCQQALKCLADVFENGAQQMHVLDVGYRLAQHCRESCSHLQDVPRAFARAFVEYLLSRSEDLEIEKDLVLTREQWNVKFGSTVKSVVYATLERIGHPVHYKELAERIRADSETFKEISGRRVHACLCNYSDFQVAGRGTYGLAGWDIKPYKTHGEAVIELLRTHGQAMRGAHIISRLTRDGEFKEPNIRAALATHPRIVQAGQDTYDLRERSEQQGRAHKASDLVVMVAQRRERNGGAASSGLCLRTSRAGQTDRCSTVVDRDTESQRSAWHSARDVEVGLFDRIVSVVTGNLNTSYKPVLLLSILDCLGRDGCCSVREVAKRFLGFYRDRLRRGLAVERADASVLTMEREGSREPVNQALSVLKHNPLRILITAGLFVLHDQRLAASDRMKSVLRDAQLVVKLRMVLGRCITDYFQALGDKAT
jgi:hypothetical protein